MRPLYSPVLRLAPEIWAGLALLGFVGFSAFEEGSLLWPGVCAALAGLLAVYGFGGPRNTHAKPSGVLAPVDGRVAFRRECHDPYLGREAIRIGIAIKPWANYLFRSPVEGEVSSIPGSHRRVSRIQTDEGDEIVLVVSKGKLFGGRPVWVPIGERVGQGKRCGVRRAALWMDVYLPANARVEVQMSQDVKSGETLLATLLRKN